MGLAKNISIPKGSEVREEAVKSLINELGLMKAAVFIKEYLSSNLDYLDIKREIFSDKTVDEITNEFKK